MFKKFGLRYLPTVIPVGFGATRKFYLDIAEYFNCRDILAETISTRENQVRKALKCQIEYLQGKKVAIFGSTLDELPLALALQEIGMKVVYVSATPNNHILSNHAKLMEQEGLILSCFPEKILNISDELKIISNTDLDLVLGNFPHIDLAKKRGIAGAQIIWSLQRKLGFDGMSYIINFCYKYINMDIFRGQANLRQLFSKE